MNLDSLSLWSALSSGTKEEELSLSEELIRPVPLEETPHFPECDYDNNPTKLFKAIEAQRWFHVKKFLLSGIWHGEITPDEKTPSGQVCTWVTKYEPTIDGNDECGKWTQLPIHAAITFGAPDDVIKILLKICPGSARCADEQRKLPLHLAFCHGASDETIGFLLDLFPLAVGVRDFEGKTPLECASDGPQAQRSKIIQTILNRNKAQWEKKQAKLEANQRKQSELLKSTKNSLRNKVKEISNLSTEVDLVKWREDQSKKTLLTLVSELKDINDWYTQHEKVATKDEIVEDLTAKLTDLHQVAINLVVEIERQKSENPPQGDVSKWHLFGNVPSTGEGKTDADAESVSVYSIGTKNSCYEDEIQMNPFIVFMGPQDGPSHVSDKSGVRETTDEEATPPMVRNGSLDSAAKSSSTQKTDGMLMNILKKRNLVSSPYGAKDKESRDKPPTPVNNASTEDVQEIRRYEMATEKEETAPADVLVEALSAASSTVSSYHMAPTHDVVPVAPQVTSSCNNTIILDEGDKGSVSCEVSCYTRDSTENKNQDQERLVFLSLETSPSQNMTSENTNQDGSGDNKQGEVPQVHAYPEVLAAPEPTPKNRAPKRGSLLKSLKKASRKLSVRKLISRKSSKSSRGGDAIVQTSCGPSEQEHEHEHEPTLDKPASSNAISVLAEIDHTVSRAEVICLPNVHSDLSTTGSYNGSSLRSVANVLVESEYTNDDDEAPAGILPALKGSKDEEEAPADTEEIDEQVPSPCLPPDEASGDMEETKTEIPAIIPPEDTRNTGTDVPAKVAPSPMFESLLSIGNLSRDAQAFFDQLSLANADPNAKVNAKSEHDPGDSQAFFSQLSLTGRDQETKEDDVVKEKQHENDELKTSVEQFPLSQEAPDEEPKESAVVEDEEPGTKDNVKLADGQQSDWNSRYQAFLEQISVTCADQGLEENSVNDNPNNDDSKHQATLGLLPLTCEGQGCKENVKLEDGQQGQQGDWNSKYQSFLEQASLTCADQESKQNVTSEDSQSKDATRHQTFLNKLYLKYVNQEPAETCMAKDSSSKNEPNEVSSAHEEAQAKSSTDNTKLKAFFDQFITSREPIETATVKESPSNREASVLNETSSTNEEAKGNPSTNNAKQQAFFDQLTLRQEPIETTQVEYSSNNDEPKQQDVLDEVSSTNEEATDKPSKLQAFFDKSTMTQEAQDQEAKEKTMCEDGPTNNDAQNSEIKPRSTASAFDDISTDLMGTNTWGDKAVTDRIAGADDSRDDCSFPVWDIDSPPADDSASWQEQEGPSIELERERTRSHFAGLPTDETSPATSGGEQVHKGESEAEENSSVDVVVVLPSQVEGTPEMKTDDVSTHSEVIYSEEGGFEVPFEEEEEEEVAEPEDDREEENEPRDETEEQSPNLQAVDVAVAPRATQRPSLGLRGSIRGLLGSKKSSKRGSSRRLSAKKTNKQANTAASIVSAARE